MNIVYAPTYKQGSTQYVAIHNTGGLGSNALASSIHLDAYAVNTAHRQRFNFPSQFMKDPTGAPWYGGYNFYIDKNGVVTQFRAIGEETAAQIGYNQQGIAISICLAGNGEYSPTLGREVDILTGAQIVALRALVDALPQVWYPNIVPHRYLQPSTGCYGSSRDNAWGRNLIIAGVIERIQAKLMDLIAQLKALQARGGSIESEGCLFEDNRG